ncbi:MAG: TolC family protein [Chlorobi bacterium]|nr:TolC family protein [Chlorobiota bacterium]
MRKTLILLLVALAPLAIHAQQRVPLSRAVALALEQNEQIREARLGVRQAELDVAKAKASRLPSLDFSTSYSYLSDLMSINLPSLPGIPARTITFGDHDIMETGITVSMPLFTGFKLSALQDIQEQKALLAREDTRAAANRVRFLTITVYRMSQMWQRTDQLLAAGEAQLSKRLRTARALVEQGQILAADTLDISTRLQEIRIQRLHAQQQQRYYIFRISQLTGLPESIEVEPDTLAKGLLPAVDEQTLLSTAFANLPEMKKLDLSRRLTNARKKAESSAFYPSVFIAGSYKYGRPGLDQIANEWMDYWTAGVRLEWNLFRWGSDVREQEKLDLELQKLNFRDALLRKQVAEKLRAARIELEDKQQAITLLESKQAMQQEKFDIVQARFARGMATSTELVDAETALTQTTIRMHQTVIEYQLKNAELEYIAGTPLTGEQQ